MIIEAFTTTKEDFLKEALKDCATAKNVWFEDCNISAKNILQGFEKKTQANVTDKVKEMEKVYKENFSIVVEKEDGNELWISCPVDESSHIALTIAVKVMNEMRVVGNTGVKVSKIVFRNEPCT